MSRGINKIEIINEIRKQFALNFREPNSFFITITNDYNDLFNKYGVNIKKDVWIYRAAESHEDALLIKKFFVDMGLKTNNRNIPQDAKFVIAYKITKKPKKIKPIKTREKV